MIELFQVIVLSIIQGITEFLPISSSAHLILMPTLLEWQDQGLAFDVAVHVGTLLAVLFYFKKDLKKLTKAWFSSIFNQKLCPESKLAWAIGFATIPVGLAGLAFKPFVETIMRDPIVIAYATLFFGALLYLADKWGKRIKSEEHLTWRDVFCVGVAQAVALIPGTSRSGITITAGLMMGLTRQAAARFSFLLSIPVIILAGGLQSVQLVRTTTLVDWNAMFLGGFLSFASAYLCIHVFLKLLDKIGLLPFVIYRLILGSFLLFLFL